MQGKAKYDPENTENIFKTVWDFFKNVFCIFRVIFGFSLHNS
jgi:uncharacterized membrane protein YesL